MTSTTHDTTTPALSSMKSTIDGRIGRGSGLRINLQTHATLSSFREELAAAIFGWQVWHLGHSVFFALTLLAEFASRRARDLIELAAWDEAVEVLYRLAAVLRARGLAYTISGAFSESTYKIFIRAAMPQGFSGTALREQCPFWESHSALTRQHTTPLPHAIQVALQQLECSYQEAEVRHVEVARRLVPEQVSLLQEKLVRQGLDPTQHQPNEEEFQEYDNWFHIDRASYSDSEMAAEIKRVISEAIPTAARLCSEGHLTTEQFFAFLVGAEAASSLLLTTPPDDAVALAA